MNFAGRLQMLAFVVVLTIVTPPGDVVWAGPSISSIPSVILAGSAFQIKGSGFTKGSVINLFVNPRLFPPINKLWTANTRRLGAGAAFG
jgi:hypothetical protein